MNSDNPTIMLEYDGQINGKMKKKLRESCTLLHSEFFHSFKDS